MLDFMVQMLVHSNLHGHASSSESRADAKDSFTAKIDQQKFYELYRVGQNLLISMLIEITRILVFNRYVDFIRPAFFHHHNYIVTFL